MKGLRRADFIINLIIAVSVLCAVLWYFVGGEDAMGVLGLSCFRYFTTDSNILMGICSSSG